jgi:hypothetical protein
MGLDEAIQEAGETRFVPIILTTLTAIGGLIPLVAESNPLYSPLALVIIGGLLSSTILTRVVTPVLYKLLAPASALCQNLNNCQSGVYCIMPLYGQSPCGTGFLKSEKPAQAQAPAGNRPASLRQPPISPASDAA